MNILFIIYSLSESFCLMGFHLASASDEKSAELLLRGFLQVG